MDSLPPSATGAEDPLEALVAEGLELFEAEGQAGLEALLERHPEQAADLRRRLAALVQLGLVAEPGSGDTPELPEQIGEFRLRSRLGGGGMGLVFLARQEALNRDVALKIVRPELLLFGDARERFRREVQAVAQLQHPGIVQVFAVGEHQGLPWFAMEYAHGATLAEIMTSLAGRKPAELGTEDLRLALERLCDERARALGLPQEQSGRSPSSHSSTLDPLAATTWATAMARIIEQAALAVQHAHERSILHRDIKPSNLLLTRSGRVLLFDFGLAREQGVERLTATGGRVGSLAYMAPEQLEGKSDERTDVYGLGATLYECLTLRLPFEAASGELLAARIQSGDLPTPRRIAPGIPFDLETILLTALERDPARRYPSAAALAEDLGRLLALQPIAARRPGRIQRYWRVVVRHPARFAAVGLLAVLLLFVPLLWIQLDSEKQQAVGSARHEADQNLVLALKAVETLLVRAGDEALRDTPGTAEAQEVLLQEALRFLDDVQIEDRSDLRLVGERVLVLTRLAQVRQRQGRWADLRVAVDEGLELSDQWIARDGDDPGAWLARYHLLVAAQEGSKQERTEERSLALAADALRTAERRCALAPEDDESAMALADALDRRASRNASEGQVDGAIADWLEAEARVRPLLQKQATNDQQWTLLSAILNNHAEALRSRGRPAEALPLLEESAQLQDQANARWQTETDALANLLVTHGNLAQARLALGQVQAAHADLAPWKSRGEERLALFPENVILERAVAALHSCCARIELELELLDSALLSIERAIELRRHSVARAPNSPDGLRDVASHLGVRSEILRRSDRGEEGLNSALDGLEVLARLPNLPTGEWLVARNLYMQAGRCAEDLGYGLMLAKLSEAMEAALGQNPNDLRMAAGMLCRVLPLIEAQPDLDERTRQELTDTHLEHCRDMLLRAARGGGLDPEDLEIGLDFDWLRRRADFADLKKFLFEPR